ncbi:MAG: leucine-rich repeat domain-containing protein, partial [bacterium]|nr:leucine-rich repeat domain-containing protein [bacterium]
MTKKTKENKLAQIKKAQTEKAKELQLDGIDKEAFALLCKVTSLEKLYLGNAVFKEITDDIAKLKNLKELTFYNGEIESISEKIGKLKFLKSLTINDNDKLKSIPAAIGELSGLENLELSYNEMLQELPESIGKLNNLKELDVYRCSLKQLPASIGDLENLETMNLQDNQLSSLPATLHKLKKLKDLDLDDNPLDYPQVLRNNIPAILNYYSEKPTVKNEYYEFYKDGKYKFWEVTQYNKTVYLFYGNNGRETTKELPFDKKEKAQEDFTKRIEKKKKEGYVQGRKDFPLDLQKEIESAISNNKKSLRVYDATEEIFKEICKISSLTDLDLCNSEMKRITEDISGLKKLKKFEMSCTTALESIHENMSTLTELESLEINNADIPKLFKGIGKLTNLTSLELKRSKIVQIPEEIGSLVKLKRLELSSNNIKKLPESIGQLKKLTRLELDHNQLKKLPEGIGGLESLEHLDLGDNALEKLPETIGELEKLEDLDLGQNKLKELPESIGDLENLEDLDLRDNKLKSLPHSIGSLSSLEDLDLYQNELTALPPTMIQLEDLDDLNVGENNLKLPGAISTIPEILAWFSGDGELKKPEARTYEPDETEKNLSEKEKEQLVKQYKDKIKQFERDTKYESESKRDAIITFISGKTDSVPISKKKEYQDFDDIVKVLAPLDDWTFVDRRILTYMAGDDWYWKKGKYHKGFYDDFYAWAKKQLESNPHNFEKLLAELNKSGIVDDAQIIEQCIKELHEVILNDQGEPLPLGTYLLEHYDEHIDLMLEASSGYIYQYPLIGLFTKYKGEDFDSKIEGLLYNHDCAPHEKLSHLCRIDAKKYEPFVLRAMEMETSCRSCLMRTAKLMLEEYQDKYYSNTLDEAKKTLEYLREKKKEDPGYDFPWAERWVDGTADFVKWALQTFKKDIITEVFGFVEKTKFINLDVIEAVANTAGQDGIEIMCEALYMKDTGDQLKSHYQRLFSILNPFDVSKHNDKLWEIVQYKSLEINKLAAAALAKQGNPTLKKALELHQSKKKKERQAAILVLTHFSGNEEAAAILKDLRNEETGTEIRQEIQKVTEITFPDVLDSIENLSKGGKLKKQVKKWINEEELPLLKWKDSGEKLNTETVRFLFFRQAKIKELEPDKEVKLLLDKIKKSESGEFAGALMELVFQNGGIYAKNRFALAIIGSLADAKTIKELKERAIKDKNVNAVKSIGLNDSNEALRALDEIKRAFRTKYPNVLGAAEEAFSGFAKERGVSEEELLDIIIPDFDFSGRFREFDFSGKIYKGFID